MSRRTGPRVSHRRGAAAWAAIVMSAGAFVTQVQGHASAAVQTERGAAQGNAREPVSQRPTIEAAFTRESFRPGETATLALFDRARDVTVRLLRVGDAIGPLAQRDAMRGQQVGPERHFDRLAPPQVLHLGLGSSWPSGLYYAELSAPGDRVGYAPFVLAPRRLGAHRIAVVLPTETWQAYNFRDDDHDGVGNTWYASPEIATAALHRPFENRGVPAHYRIYDEPFLRWLARNRYAVDYLSDAELRTTTGRTLAAGYELLIFPGHHEYVTGPELRAVTGFRNRGGNLAFLSANNFFRKITIDRGVMTIVGQWRALGRPEAALVGVQYFSSGSVTSSGSPWIVRGGAASDTLFRYTGLVPGSAFGSGGIEADRVGPSSPPGVEVVAEIPHVFGDGRKAQMTIYRASSGARVFAAGAFSLAACVWQPPVQQLLINLIEDLSPGTPPPDVGAGAAGG
jgi:hypothetical protein